MAEVACYELVAWVRSGIGALLGGSGADLRVDIDGASPAVRHLAPYRAADATGLDPRAIVRTVPTAGVLDFEPNLFPSVELAHPGLPWLLSPPADSLGHTTPWIALVVVEEQRGVSLSATGSTSVLTIEAPAAPSAELPDPAQAWAWAHAQTVTASTAPFDPHVFARSDGEARSRLVAARKLLPDRRYLACIVPVVSATGTAWSVEAPRAELPVYFSWRFSTGAAGDFASLAKLLRPEPLPSSCGHRAIDLTAPGWGMPPSAGVTTELTGALRSPRWTPAAPGDPERDLGDAIATQIDEGSRADAVTVLPPPSYGATATHEEALHDAPAWQQELNRDVRERMAAGLGASVVRGNLEALVDAAWQAAGDAERANAAIRHAQLAGELATTLTARHLAKIPDDGEALAIARPLFARMHEIDVKGPMGTPTLVGAIRASAMPGAALASSMRRLGRASGPLARSTPRVATGRVLATADAKQIVPVPPKQLPTGAAGFDEISAQQHILPRLHLATPEAIETAATHWTSIATAAVSEHSTATPTPMLRRITDIPIGEIDVPPLVSVDPQPDEIGAFVAAARRHQAYIVGKLESVSDHPRPSFGQLHVGRPLAAVRAQIEAQFTPRRGIAPLLAAQLTGIALDPSASFQPIQIVPELDRPLVDALQAISPEHVLPGVGGITANRAALADTAPEFVRAFLVGANEQLGRELLWRGFPSSREHTWLRAFWGAAAPDIPAIESWPPQGVTPAPASLVLVVKADVLHRYPNAVVYALEARWQGSHRVPGTGAPMPPTMTASLGSDVALFGFSLDDTTARGTGDPSGSAGWYFVIAEHPHEPRFGLAASATASLTSWRDLAWSDLAASDLSGNYLRVDGPLARRTFAGDPQRWGSDAAAVAAITQRRAVRVAMHAVTLLGDPT